MTTEERKEYKLRMKEAKKEAKRIAKKTKRENKTIIKKNKIKTHDILMKTNAEYRDNHNGYVALVAFIIITAILLVILKYHETLFPFVESLVNSFK